MRAPGDLVVIDDVKIFPRAKGWNKAPGIWTLVNDKDAYRQTGPCVLICVIPHGNEDACLYVVHSEAIGWFWSDMVGDR